MFRAHRAHHHETRIVSTEPLVALKLPTCTRHNHRHRATANRGCIDTICLSWWWARCARNM